MEFIILFDAHTRNFLLLQRQGERIRAEPGCSCPAEEEEAEVRQLLETSSEQDPSFCWEGKGAAGDYICCEEPVLIKATTQTPLFLLWQ